MTINRLLQRFGPALDETMRAVVARAADERGFRTMIEYALGWVETDGTPYRQATGKRIRPLIVLLCAEASGGDWRTALPAAAAVELLHNFSLIHDDIQDASPTRHGRPTVWKVWGTANAINAGDAMFSLAYCALARLSDDGLPEARILKAWHLFNTTNLELTRGQHLDMAFESTQSVDKDAYLSMITGKSAALIAASAQLGALVATGDVTLSEKFHDFGLNVGIAFQIRDDILGIWGEPDVTGKSAAIDILARKKSLPVLIGLERSATLTQTYRKSAFTSDDVEGVLRELEAVDARSATEAMEAAYFGRAIAALQTLDLARPSGTELSELAHLLLGRSA